MTQKKNYPVTHRNWSFALAATDFVFKANDQRKPEESHGLCKTGDGNHLDDCHQSKLWFLCNIIGTKIHKNDFKPNMYGLSTVVKDQLNATISMNHAIWPILFYICSEETFLTTWAECVVNKVQRVIFYGYCIVPFHSIRALKMIINCTNIKCLSQVLSCF